MLHPYLNSARPVLTPSSDKLLEFGHLCFCADVVCCEWGDLRDPVSESYAPPKESTLRNSPVAILLTVGMSRVVSCA